MFGNFIITVNPWVIFSQQNKNQLITALSTREYTLGDVKFTYLCFNTYLCFIRFYFHTPSPLFIYFFNISLFIINETQVGHKANTREYKYFCAVLYQHFLQQLKAAELWKVVVILSVFSWSQGTPLLCCCCMTQDFSGS